MLADLVMLLALVILIGLIVRLEKAPVQRLVRLLLGLVLLWWLLRYTGVIGSIPVIR